MKKIKEYLKNPIIVFLCLFLILFFIILIGTHFKMPDFYTDRQAAEQVIQIPDLEAGRAASEIFENFSYKVWNIIYQIFYLVSVIFLLTLCFKITSFKNFKKLISIKNKPFIFIWINLSFIMNAIAFQYSYMNDLQKLVYNSYHDSFGIPYFQTMLHSIFLATMYYPALNVLYFIIYNTNISRLIYVICLLFWLQKVVLYFLSACVLGANIGNFFLFLYAIVWLCLIASGINVLFEKRFQK